MEDKRKPYREAAFPFPHHLILINILFRILSASHLASSSFSSSSLIHSLSPSPCPSSLLTPGSPMIFGQLYTKEKWAKFVAVSSSIERVNSSIHTTLFPGIIRPQNSMELLIILQFHIYSPFHFHPSFNIYTVI